MSAAMLDTTKYSKAFNTQLIELFRSKACLWRAPGSLEDRASGSLLRHERDCAWQTIVDKLREVDPSADKTFAVKKMNAFRSSWRREHKKVKRWRAVGEKYYPKLWYYDMFKFIEDDDDSGSPWEWDHSADGSGRPDRPADCLNQTMAGASFKSEMIYESSCDMDEVGYVLPTLE